MELPQCRAKPLLWPNNDLSPIQHSYIKKEIFTDRSADLQFSSRCFQMCMGIYSKWLLWWWWKCNDNNTAVKLQHIRTSQNDLRCQLCQHKNCALHMKQNICKQVAIKTQTILPRNTSTTRDCSGNFHQSKSTLIRGVYHQVPASAKLQYTKTCLVHESLHSSFQNNLHEL